ncbi:hypothetical protein [Caldisphaera sp.]|uniref:hypothetical protein n=1 Tax=Caldisphaera sp. TaxID=2060322 RepID=UPI00397ACDD0
MAFYLLKPLKPFSFRWTGEFSPSTSGPMNKGISEPLPLPSTIAGFLYSINKKWGSSKNLENLKIDEDLKTLASGIWGPLLYDGMNYYAHKYPGGLIQLKMNNSLYIDKPQVNLEKNDVGEKLEALSEKGVINVINRIGIGLMYNSKTVKEGLLYSQSLIKLKNGGIIFKANSDVNEGFYTMGGEGSIIELKKCKECEEIISGKGDYGLVISPIILKPRENVTSIIDDFYELNIEGCGKLSDLRVNIPVNANNKEKSLKKYFRPQIKLGLISLGFNITYNVIRPIYLAIMPGSIINCKEMGNVGLFKEVGWGSILPIKINIT